MLTVLISMLMPGWALMNWSILMSSSTMASTRPAARSANSTSLVVKSFSSLRSFRASMIGW